MRKVLVILILLGFPYLYLVGEESFILIDGTTGATVREFGPNINERITPCSTFKIPLSLMGYETGILEDEKTPTWDFQQGYDDDVKSWKVSHTPQSWIKYSCVWYSKILALQLGMETIQSYLASFEYGNQDMSEGLEKPGPKDPVWMNSSLKISPREQVDFIRKMIDGQLPISKDAVEKTRLLLFVSELSDGWKLFCKRGYGQGKNSEVWWFVGWVEKDHNFFPFAYNLRERKINPSHQTSRLMQLLEESFDTYTMLQK